MILPEPVAEPTPSQIGEIKRAADARFAFEPDAPAHQLDEPAADRSGPSPVPPCLRVVDMSAWVNGWNSFAACSLRHADAGVAHGELELHFLAGAFELFDVQAGFRRAR